MVHEVFCIGETSVAKNTSGLVPQRQKASHYENSDPDPQLQNVSSSADAHVPSQQELDLLFGHLYDEFFNAGSNPQDKQPSTNIQPTSEPSTPTYVHAEENNDDQAEEGEHVPDDEFTNPFCTPGEVVHTTLLSMVHEVFCIGEKYALLVAAFCLPDMFLVAFCSLRFVKKRHCALVPAFWFLRLVSCNLVLRFGLAFCLKTSCVLPKDKLRFASKLVAFCFKTRCVLLQDILRFASGLLRFVSIFLRFISWVALRFVYF
nr:hypothetical protein [Tanacetum cinerariifolium]